MCGYFSCFLLAGNQVKAEKVVSRALLFSSWALYFEIFAEMEYKEIKEIQEGGNAMSQISAVNGNPQAGWEKIQAGGKKGEETGINSSEPLPGRIGKDRVELFEDKSDMDWKDMVKKALDRLREQYPSLRIIIDEQEKGGNLSGLAAGLGKGTHLVISQKFLKRMGSGAEEFSKCSSLLAGIAKQLAGQMGNGIAAGSYVGESSAVFWIVPEKGGEKQGGLSAMLDMAKKTTDKNNAIFKQISKASAFAVSQYYSRMAGASTKGQIQSVMVDAQKEMVNLRMMASFGDDEEKVKASRALHSLEKLLMRGGEKINRLEKEMMAALDRKRAEKRQEERRAEQAKQEMKRLRAGRAGFDHSLVMEGMGDENYIREYRHPHLPEYEAVMPGGDMLPADISAGAAGGGMGGGMGGGEIAAADVVVTDAISF
jgi:hypothetical protein